jgi:heme o synthase
MSLASAPALGRPGMRRLLLGYLELTKPRIVLLVILTGVPALLLAARGVPAPGPFLGALLGTALAAASAACFNHYLDRDVDALMRRTAGRPLPSGLLPASHALALGVALAALAGLVLATFGNRLAAALGLASIFYYAVVYTWWLKRRTPQNIVIGGGAGASAPLIAWAAVTGGIGLPALVMSAVVFLWTPPHFWSLALVRHEDYARARIPMLPVTHGDAETRRQILAYTFALVPVTLALAPLGVAGPIYWVPATLLGALFVRGAWRLAHRPDAGRAMRLFRFSILYLFTLFVALTVDALVRARG